jgi:hypothetical protein
MILRPQFARASDRSQASPTGTPRKALPGNGEGDRAQGGSRERKLGLNQVGLEAIWHQARRIFLMALSCQNFFDRSVRGFGNVLRKGLSAFKGILSPI